MDLVIVLGFALIVVGFGIKMRKVEKVSLDNRYIKTEKISEPIEILININTASIIELEILPAIGPKTAQKIIDYRNRWGSYKSKEEIKKVSGIGEKTYEKIMDKIEI